MKIKILLIFLAVFAVFFVMDRLAKKCCPIFYQRILPPVNIACAVGMCLLLFYHFYRVLTSFPSSLEIVGSGALLLLALALEIAYIRNIWSDWRSKDGAKEET